LGVDFQLVNDAASAEMTGVLVSVRYVVLMRQENAGHTTERLQPANKLRQELGRIDEPVAPGAPNEVAAAAERFGRGEPAVINVAVDQQWEIGHCGFGIVPAARADRASGTGQQRVQGGALISRIRLRLDERVAVGLAEDARGKLPAGVAVDA